MATSLHVLVVRGIVLEALTILAMAAAAVAVGEVSLGFMVGVGVLAFAVGAVGEYVLSFFDGPPTDQSAKQAAVDRGHTLALTTPYVAPVGAVIVATFAGLATGASIAAFMAGLSTTFLLQHQ